MELIVAIGLLIALALAAPRWGCDSRHFGSDDGWFGAPRARRGWRNGGGAPAVGALGALAGQPRRVGRAAGAAVRLASAQPFRPDMTTPRT